MVEIMGSLIREIAVAEDIEEESREKKLNGLFDLLNERFLDLSSSLKA